MNNERNHHGTVQNRFVHRIRRRLRLDSTGSRVAIHGDPVMPAIKSLVSKTHLRTAFVAVALATAACTQAIPKTVSAEEVFQAPAAERTSRETDGLKNAYFAGGCFWGVEAVFSHVPGVSSAVSGYHGGTAEDANYGDVSAGITTHAETVKIVYDPSVVRYDQLVRIFMSIIIDPTQADGQGPDRGAHYRSALIPVSSDQREVASAYLSQMRESDVWSRPIVTQIENAQRFYEAETYHQDFAEKNPNHGYIRQWDAPMVRALSSMYPDHYRASFQTG